MFCFFDWLKGDEYGCGSWWSWHRGTLSFSPKHEHRRLEKVKQLGELGCGCHDPGPHLIRLPEATGHPQSSTSWTTQSTETSVLSQESSAEHPLCAFRDQTGPVNSNAEECVFMDKAWYRLLDTFVIVSIDGICFCVRIMFQRLCASLASRRKNMYNMNQPVDSTHDHVYIYLQAMKVVNGIDKKHWTDGEMDGNGNWSVDMSSGNYGHCRDFCDSMITDQQKHGSICWTLCQERLSKTL